jgi:hypothetical protein
MQNQVYDPHFSAYCGEHLHLRADTDGSRPTVVPYTASFSPIYSAWAGNILSSATAPPPDA